MSEDTQNTKQQVQNSSETPEPAEIHVVLVNEFDNPQVLTFTTPEEAAASIKDYRQTNKRFHVFVFEGKKWHMTAGKNPYLVSFEQQKRLPLFEEDPEDQINESGFIG